MTTGRFERSEDGQTWEAISPDLVRFKLSNTYLDVDLAIKAMTDDGETIRTAYAFYRFSR